jgi:hypothetical protein
MLNSSKVLGLKKQLNIKAFEAVSTHQIWSGRSSTYSRSSPTGSVVSMVGGLHGVTLLHSMGRAGVEERSYSNGVEWSD